MKTADPTMAPAWDADEIGAELADRYPEKDPLRVRDAELRLLLPEAPSAPDEVEGLSENALSQIRDCWLCEFLARRE